MAITYKRLGAVLSSGVIATPDATYTTTTGVIISTIAICNQAASSATYRINVSTTTSFAGNGYLAFNATVAANETVFLTCGFTMDSVNKYLLTSASAATVNFQVFGSEVS